MSEVAKQCKEGKPCEVISGSLTGLTVFLVAFCTRLELFSGISRRNGAWMLSDLAVSGRAVVFSPDPQQTCDEFTRCSCRCSILVFITLLWRFCACGAVFCQVCSTSRRKIRCTSRPESSEEVADFWAELLA